MANTHVNSAWVRLSPAKEIMFLEREVPSGDMDVLSMS